MKTKNSNTTNGRREDFISSVVERDEVASANLQALNTHNRTFTHVATTTGEIKLGVDPVIYRNVADSIIRLAMRRYYKGNQ
jgi:hypothetical protein